MKIYKFGYREGNFKEGFKNRWKTVRLDCEINSVRAQLKQMGYDDIRWIQEVK